MRALKVAYDSGMPAVSKVLATVGAKRNIKIALPDADHSSVEAWVDWLDSSRGNLKQDDLHLLAKMYLFGENVESETFCEAVLRRMMIKADRGHIPDTETVNLLFESAKNNSPVLQFLVDAWVAGADSSRLKGGPAHVTLHPEFGQRLLVALFDRSREGSDMNKDTPGDKMVAALAVVLCIVILVLVVCGVLRWTRTSPWTHHKRQADQDNQTVVPPQLVERGKRLWRWGQ